MKEHGVGKRKSSYTFEQLEQVFGQGGWDAQPCQPVLINSSGLYQELESDGSTMEEYSQEDWGNHSQDLHGYPTDQELGKKAGIYDTCGVCVCLYLSSPVLRCFMSVTPSFTIPTDSPAHVASVCLGQRGYPSISLTLPAGAWCLGFHKVPKDTEEFLMLGCAGKLSDRLCN